MNEPYRGILPIAPVVFHDNGDLDIDGNRRVMDLMVDQGVDGICILANFSEQFLLTDAERDEVMRLSIEQIAGRVPVIVTTSHFSTRVAAARAKAAADAGAKMLMMMPPYHGALLKADEQGMIEHFKMVADACGIPIILQDAPLSGVTMTVPFMVRLAQEVPLVRYFKIEMPGTANKLRALIEAGGDAVVGPFDGEEAITLMADLDAGATGTMTSAMIPDLIKPILAAHAAGDRKQAAALYAKVLPIINYENRQCGLRAAKAVMKAGGVIKSDAVRHPLAPLHPKTREGLLELARELDPLALRWGK
ncbi:dihydrodipicolinate synthase family protein [Bosea sp. AS-1]|uniref:dihydrodipicolinate synthase family protein n=1 Tax=Bosea sp. AS-1 TaxID=2015316 RepID=UPI000B795E54|nr:dihydrodipicolinate synthase family protein [Bosea sp. AS-1]